jgi:hypothetical protein
MSQCDGTLSDVESNQYSPHIRHFIYNERGRSLMSIELQYSDCLCHSEPFVPMNSEVIADPRSSDGHMTADYNRRLQMHWKALCFHKDVESNFGS